MVMKFHVKVSGQGCFLGMLEWWRGFRKALCWEEFWTGMEYSNKLLGGKSNKLFIILQKFSFSAPPSELSFTPSKNFPPTTISAILIL